jgi:hypothetical protein
MPMLISGMKILSIWQGSHTILCSKKAKSREYNLRLDTIVIAGSARLPKNVTTKHVFGCVTIELEVDLADKTIVDISCTLVPTLGEKILRDSLLGNKVDEGIEEAIIQLDSRFFNVTRRAVIAALEDTFRCYKKSLKKIAVRNTI